MTEAQYLKKLRAVLKTRYGPDIFFFKTHGGPFQQAGLPDVIGVYRGKFFGLEVKQPFGTVTPLQYRTLSDIHNAGGEMWVVWTTTLPEKVIEWLDQFESS